MALCGWMLRILPGYSSGGTGYNLGARLTPCHSGLVRKVATELPSWLVRFLAAVRCRKLNPRKISVSICDVIPDKQ